jgi:hypothetical protein
VTTIVAGRRLRSREDPRCEGKAHLAAMLERAHIDHVGRAVRHDSWNVLYAVWEWYVYATARDGDLTRSVPQIVRGVARRHPELQWDTAGRSIRWINSNYGVQVRRNLDKLAAMGLIPERREEVRASNGRGVGIRLRARADVAQLAAATSRRRASRRRGATCSPAPPASRSRKFFGSQLSTPFGGSGPGFASPTPRRGSSSARARLIDTTGRWSVDDCLAALDAVNDFTERSGVEIVEAVPELAAVDVGVVAQAVWRRERREPLTPKVSAKLRRQVDAAVRRLGHYGYDGLDGPAAGVAAAIDVAGGDWRQWHRTPPKTLGGLLHAVKRLANERRRHERARRASRG